MSLTGLHPVARANGYRQGHRPRVRKAQNGIGYVAVCSCRGWAKRDHTRRQVIRAFHLHLAHIALADLRRAA